MNEHDFIRRLREQTRSRKHSSRLVTGIGDDASVISQLANRDLVVTTDLLIEGVDFYCDAAPARSGRCCRLACLRRFGGTISKKIFSPGISSWRICLV